MSQFAVQVEGISKEYQLGLREKSGQTFREAIVDLAKAPLRRLRHLSGQADEAGRFWALKNITFDIAQGEVMGIIGHNGAGKSTLLKILSRITEPTTGQARIYGRVASLLEVGTGFHNELSGRENVYLNGAILGMSRREIDSKFDEIIDFSGVEKFLDTPIKRYSSGMKVRLAFAVAAHLEPEILIIDEVLAVGDQEFQNRCLGKMQDVATSGRTVLFVSHNMPAVEKLCSSVMLLSGGSVAGRGEVRRMISEYLSYGSSGQLSWQREHPTTDQIAVLESVAVSDSNGEVAGSISAGEPILIRIDLEVRKPVSDLKLAACVFDEQQSPVFSTHPIDNDCEYPDTPGRYRYWIAIPPHTLMPRRFSVTVSIYTMASGIDSAPHCVTFDVHPRDTVSSRGNPNRPGPVFVRCAWMNERNPSGPSGDNDPTTIQHFLRRSQASHE